jgi:hypothetical protein
VLPGVGGVYIGLIALVANLAVCALITTAANMRGVARSADATSASDYDDPLPG